MRHPPSRVRIPLCPSQGGFALFKVERKDFGVSMAFEGALTLDEVKRWSQEALRILPTLAPGFGVLADNRALRPGALGPEAQTILEQTQALYKQKGMARSCVILNSAAVTMQLERAAQHSGIKSSERFLNAASRPDWEQAAVAWIRDGVEPDDRVT